MLSFRLLAVSFLVASAGAMVSMSNPPTMSRQSGQSFKTMYENLADRAIELQKKCSSPTGQVFIAVAGGPGSGKSTLAEQVSSIINERHQERFACVVPMDGYHKTREELQRMGNLGGVIGDPESTTGESTSYEDLLARRGSPWTFSSDLLIRDFLKAKEDGEAVFPTYSREKSDPVPGGEKLTKNDKIVLCEGLYLCAFDSPDWEPLATFFDEKWYATAPPDVIMERLIGRHLKTWTDEKAQMFGEGRKGAEAKARSNDFKNAVWIEQVSAHHADLILEHH